MVGYLLSNQGPAQTEHELENAFEIQRIYLLKAYQGQGLGKKLLSLLLKKQSSQAVIGSGWEFGNIIAGSEILFQIRI